MEQKRASFSGKIGFVLAAAGSAVGLGNIWRFPYLAAKYGGGIFLLVYIILAVTFGYSMMTAEIGLGRMTRKSPVGAFGAFGKSRFLSFGGWINAVIPMIIGGYYAVIGGWVVKYFVEFAAGNVEQMAGDSAFSTFITDPVQSVVFFIIYQAIVSIVIFMGVEKGVEAVSKILLPVLVVLAFLIAIYVMTRPHAGEGILYFLVPDFSRFSLMTVVSAMEQMFYSLSIAMGILYTYGSYMKDDIDIEHSVNQIQIFDTGIAILAGLMIIPSVFAYSGGETLNAGPSLMFITLPKVFASMASGRIVGSAFFALVLLAAVTSSISLMETSVSTFVDELHANRTRCTVLMTIIYVIVGILSALGYSKLSFISIGGMAILDLLDFVSNSIMMPIAAFCTCLLVSHHVGRARFDEEILKSSKFRRRKLFYVMIRYVAPVFTFIILIASILSAAGIITV